MRKHLYFSLPTWRHQELTTEQTFKDYKQQLAGSSLWASPLPSVYQITLNPNIILSIEGVGVYLCFENRCADKKQTLNSFFLFNYCSLFFIFPLFPFCFVFFALLCMCNLPSGWIPEDRNLFLMWFYFIFYVTCSITLQMWLPCVLR